MRLSFQIFVNIFIMAMIFNSNKEQLIQAIRVKIGQIDKQCGFINHQIYQYSDERLADLTTKAQTCETQVKDLQKERDNKLSTLLKLKKDYEFLKTEGQDIQKQFRLKQQEKTRMKQSIIFLEEKDKQQTPHLQQFLTEKGKSKQNASKVRYAKQKLKKLKEKLKKQWEEAQYQHRLNNLIKQKLKQIKKSNSISKNHNGSKATALDSVDVSQESPNIGSFKQPKNTDHSERHNQSITTFRD